MCMRLKTSHIQLTHMYYVLILFIYVHMLTHDIHTTNIYPQLVALLREVKYLDQRENTDHEIPESATTVFQQSETYRKYLQVNQHSCSRYVAVITSQSAKFL